ncbi:MAG: hypothetical protein HY231_06335 [Acidobacteria bacterium]|nr:hypothetical protein [Acidobacteriota bacterium]
MPSYFDTMTRPQSSGTFGTGNRQFYSNETFGLFYCPTSAPLPIVAPPPASRNIPTGMTPIE